MNPQTTPLGVGILGAGPVVQAIHLPTLARLSDRFTVRHIMDISPDVAASVSGRVGARWSTSLEELLADPDVDVVAICSPPQFHAAQVTAAMNAGKAVLCEKPFATTPEEAAEIAATARATGVPVVVGAMHAFDPAWTAVREAWGDLPATAHTVRSTMILPFNDRYEDWSTEVLGRPGFPPPGPTTPEIRAGMMSGGVLGLAIHDLPLIRTFLPAPEAFHVDSATVLKPFGYSIIGTADGGTIQLVGRLHAQWQPTWELEVFSDDVALHIDFTPSYVHAGSAVATLSYADGTSRRFGPYEHNGYEGEWLALYALIGGDTSAAPSGTALIDDLTFALRVAGNASNYVLTEARA
ncbi:Gfo/Idh/MocA family oxidoreductase [Microbacterium sp.]|uniref:Gfo/Idh/MocA family protein n=1 Tax=Microbacterium sp. TaxID=51671 RepID=UPI002E326B25|nr:Gfo/Idh/MocA family oxidoreductase [Microbacterium sp.]HEX5727868.1 Gfo/Idh/MocA family oxidoreductase [Microbacterium sp.]